MKQLSLFESSQPDNQLQTKKERIHSIPELLKNRPEPDPRSPIVVSYGGGVDSTAMLIAMHLKGIKPDLIVFSDTGDEKDETYNYIKPSSPFSKWLKSVGFPPITRTRYRIQSAKERPRLLAYYHKNYWKSFAIASLEASLVAYQNARQSIKYTTLMEKCILLETLPSKAFGYGECSLTWKIEPLRKLVKLWLIQQKKNTAIPVRSFVAINAEEQTRLLDKRHNLRPLEDVVSGVTFRLEYPLIEWGLNKANERALIASIGLPVPPKSSCKRCPNMKISEILELSDEDYEMGCFIEENAGPFTGSIKGLGRNFSWRELKKLTPLEQLAIESQQMAKKCSCID